MKKRNVLFFAVIALIAIFAVSCQSKPAVTDGTAAPANDPNYNYRVTGNFAGWTQTFDAQYTMENVSKADPRIAPIHAALADALYVYLYEYNPGAFDPAGWTVDGYPGNPDDRTGKGTWDGNLAIKVIRLVADATEESGWFFDMWVPSTEAGAVRNLTPDTLIVGANVLDEVRDDVQDGLGSVNSNPTLLKGAVPYYFVFAVMGDRARAVGAIVK